MASTLVTSLMRLGRDAAPSWSQVRQLRFIFYIELLDHCDIIEFLNIWHDLRHRLSWGLGDWSDFLVNYLIPHLNTSQFAMCLTIFNLSNYETKWVETQIVYVSDKVWFALIWNDFRVDYVHLLLRTSFGLILGMALFVSNTKWFKVVQNTHTRCGLEQERERENKKTQVIQKS